MFLRVSVARLSVSSVSLSVVAWSLFYCERSDVEIMDVVLAAVNKASYQHAHPFDSHIPPFTAI